MDSKELLVIAMGLLQFLIVTVGGWVVKRYVKKMDDKEHSLEARLAGISTAISEKDRELERLQMTINNLKEEQNLLEKQIYELKVHTESQDAIRATEDRKHDDNFLRLEQKVNNKNQLLATLRDMPEQMKTLEKQQELVIKELTAAFVRIDELKVCYPRIRRLVHWVTVLREKLEQKGEKFSGDWLMPSAKDEEIHRHADYRRK
jgi:septal ring factor EnvC (AmiA/AmiB activator)